MKNPELGIIRTVKPISFSRAEVIAIAIALADVGAAGAAIRRCARVPEHGAQLTKPWRWLTAHFIHVNWQHALINAVALWVVARLFAPDLRPSRQLSTLVAAALAISACLAAVLPIDRLVPRPIGRVARLVLCRRHDLVDQSASAPICDSCGCRRHCSSAAGSRSRSSNPAARPRPMQNGSVQESYRKRTWSARLAARCSDYCLR